MGKSAEEYTNTLFVVSFVCLLFIPIILFAMTSAAKERLTFLKEDSTNLTKSIVNSFIIK